jgi:hypothetical protein
MGPWRAKRVKAAITLASRNAERKASGAAQLVIAIDWRGRAVAGSFAAGDRTLRPLNREPFAMFKSRTGPRAVLLGLCAGVAIGSAASAAGVRVTITNHQSAGGLFLTPLLASFHNGTYDAFDAGSVASAGVEAVAEGGDVSVEIAANPGVNFSVITSPGGFAGAPVIDPGESASIVVSVNAMTERYFSYLSMVIPSNDYFIGNDDPMGREVFNAAGVFVGGGTINILGGNVWDSGTEVSDGSGAAFSTAGGPSVDEGGVVGLAGSLAALVGTPIPAGGTIGSVPGTGDLFATIEISRVPLPGALPLMAAALGVFGLVRRKRA